jgi:hypothetical protein
VKPPLGAPDPGHGAAREALRGRNDILAAVAALQVMAEHRQRTCRGLIESGPPRGRRSIRSDGLVKLPPAFRKHSKPRLPTWYALLVRR